MATTVSSESRSGIPGYVAVVVVAVAAVVLFNAYAILDINHHAELLKAVSEAREQGMAEGELECQKDAVIHRRACWELGYDGKPRLKWIDPSPRIIYRWLSEPPKPVDEIDQDAGDDGPPPPDAPAVPPAVPPAGNHPSV